MRTACVYRYYVYSLKGAEPIIRNNFVQYRTVNVDI